jgi:hypothetical protein
VDRERFRGVVRRSEEHPVEQIANGQALPCPEAEGRRGAEVVAIEHGVGAHPDDLSR